MTTPRTASTTDARKRLAENAAAPELDDRVLDIAVAVAALLAGRIDGKQAVASIDAQTARVIAAAKAEVLHEAANDLRTNAGRAWGGNNRWLTTGTHVADLAAEWLDGMADDLAAIEARP